MSQNFEQSNDTHRSRNVGIKQKTTVKLKIDDSRTKSPEFQNLNIAKMQKLYSKNKLANP